jgi:hypothetical protein
LLHAGELTLFLGAGVSKDLGVPTWHSLARAMARESRIESKGINRKKLKGEDLAALFSKIERRNPARFETLVKRWLYCRWDHKRGNWASDTLVCPETISLLSGY